MLATTLHFLIGYTAVSVFFSLALAQFIRHSRKWSGWQHGTDLQNASAAMTGIPESFFSHDLLESDSVSDRLLVLHEILTPERVLRREPSETDWAAPSDARQQSRPLAPAAAAPRKRAEAPLSEISPVPIL